MACLSFRILRVGFFNAIKESTWRGQATERNEGIHELRVRLLWLLRLFETEHFGESGKASVANDELCQGLHKQITGPLILDPGFACEVLNVGEAFCGCLGQFEEVVAPRLAQVVTTAERKLEPVLNLLGE